MSSPFGHFAQVSLAEAEKSSELQGSDFLLCTSRLPPQGDGGLGQGNQARTQGHLGGMSPGEMSFCGSGHWIKGPAERPKSTPGPSLREGETRRPFVHMAGFVVLCGSFISLRWEEKSGEKNTG